MKVNNLKLQEALEIVKPGLANRDSIEQATSFAFIKGHVVTYNDEISISHPVEGLELEGAVSTDILYPLLLKIKQEEIEIEIKENEILIYAGKAKAGLALQSEIKLPLEEEIAQKGKWKELPKDFVKFINFAIPSCARDSSRATLTSVHITKEGFIEASDNFRLTQCHMETEMPTKNFLLPADSAMQVVKLNPIKIAEGKGWIHFQTKQGTVISCRIFEEAFPDVSSLLKMQGIKLILPKTMEEILDRAMVVAKRDKFTEEDVTIDLEDKKLKISAEADSGWITEEVALRYSGEPIHFNITPYLLKGILAETQECELTKSKIKFEGTGWVYISALRISDK